MGLTSRSTGANTSVVTFSPTPISNGREKTGVLNSALEVVVNIVDDRPVGVVKNTGEAADDTGCCMVRTGERRERAEVEATAEKRLGLALCCCIVAAIYEWVAWLQN